MNIDFEELKKELKQFKLHLEYDKNDRLIFSAPFGTGKTTFLKEYFKQENQIATYCSEKYVPIHIFPVNYSVASNEDIFQLIKHDILFNVLGCLIEFEKIEFTNLETLAAYLPSKIDEFLEKIIGFVPKTGNTLLENIEPLYKLSRSYNAFRENFKTKSEEKDVIDFLKGFSAKAGSIYEEDLITLLIQDLIQRVIKEGKQIVLIIDDLDRLDPEHIFRIMNVFSAHLDQHSVDNKFGFSKIITVCDINNIRRIFYHKYGKNVDFDGYIDKFFSREVYCFTNYYSLKGFLNGARMTNTFSNGSYFSARDVEFISDILSLLSKENRINFRNLSKLNYSEIWPDFQRHYDNAEDKAFITNLHLSKIGVILKLLLGDIDALYERLNLMISDNRTFQKESVFEYYNYYLFPVLTYREHGFKEQEFHFNPESSGIFNLKMTSKKPVGNQFMHIEALMPYSNARNTFWSNLKRSIEILDNNDAI